MRSPATRSTWCKPCRHAFVWPLPANETIAETYADDYFRGAHAGAYSDYIADATLLRARGRRYGELLRRFAEPGLVLECGAAAGLMLAGFHDAGWNATGLEPNESMAALARANGVDVRSGEMERFETDERFDAVAMIQVAAHFHDLHAALARAATVTRPSGLWLFETWNGASPTARILGRGWHGFAPPSTLRAFSPLGLERAVARYGFAPVARGRPWKPIGARHAKAILARMVETSLLARGAALVARAIPDRATLTYPFGDAFWSIFRKN